MAITMFVLIGIELERELLATSREFLSRNEESYNKKIEMLDEFIEFAEVTIVCIVSVRYHRSYTRRATGHDLVPVLSRPLCQRTQAFFFAELCS